MPDSILEAGKKAPSFKLPSSVGKTISLSDYAGRVVVLYFYPRADTPGCTKEACGFRDAIADYDAAKVAVLGISPDPVADVEAFGKKFRLNFPLLADPEKKVTREFGAFNETRGAASRYTYVIDKEGVLRKIYTQVNPQSHPDQVLAYVKEHLTEKK